MTRHLSLEPSGSELAPGLTGFEDTGIIEDRIELHIFSWTTRLAMFQRPMAGLVPTVLEPNANVSCQRQGEPAQVSKTAQLEQKLDGILSLLKDNRSQSIPESHNTAKQDQNRVSSGRQDAIPPLLTPEGSTPHGASPSRSFTTLAVRAEVYSPHTADYAEEEILNLFRSGPLEYLPFVHIPDSCRHTARQSALSVSIREKAGQALLVDCQKNLDLLQGLLVYLGWITFHCQPNKYSLCTYIQLAISVVFDLGLHKSPPDESHHAHCGGSGPMQNLKFPASKTRTMNERRAVLSCFVLSSFISQFLCKPDPMRWTAHMKGCLDVLNERKETPNDSVLVQLVQIQLVVDKVIRRSWDESESTAEDSDVPRLPTSFFIQAMQIQLQSIRNRIPPELAENKVVLFHLYQAEVALYSTAMSRSATRAEDVDVTRLNHLYACLAATKNWFDLFLAVRPEEYVSQPITVTFQVSHCMSALFYLSTFDYPGWDREAVIRTVDLQSILQQVTDRLDSVAEAAGIQNDGTDGDSWSKAARFLPKLQASWASKLPNAVTTATNSAEQSSALPSVDEGFLEAYLNWPDAWLMESLTLGSQNGL
ncbi:hypothetical protein CNMCM5793_004539 [Aspergillus hiratsukae]|uniref:Transcription factor domain-containing protein n=1 Tax=Aspergillus hiratsukae TaxID=1194566 RepID=A0A8H6QHU2_9EURO|nr:hypothetical protein CNMCM5793_004539 [Aspergillus hiratsukae]KAF7172191.1 hypothetical protein CNMCM6106_006453 [Aspergillus hiratsukae]